MRDLTVDQICEMDPYDELLTIAEVEEHEQGWDLSF